MTLLQKKAVQLVTKLVLEARGLEFERIDYKDSACATKLTEAVDILLAMDIK